MRILAELEKAGVRWQARVSGDRGRLEVVGIVGASSEPQVITPLTDAELRALLGEGSDQLAHAWVCSGCGARNARGRRWCETCSGHSAA